MCNNKQQSTIIVDGIAIDYNLVQLVKRMKELYEQTQEFDNIKRSLFMIQNSIIGRTENDLGLDLSQLRELGESFYFIFIFIDAMYEINQKGGHDKHN